MSQIVNISLDFLNFWNEAANEKEQHTGRSVKSLHALSNDCIACGGEKCQLYACSKSCAVPYTQRLELL